MVPRNIIWIVSIVPILRTMIGATNRKMHQDLMRSILVSMFEDAWVFPRCGCMCMMQPAFLLMAEMPP